jgi:hypothetical protein
MATTPTYSWPIPDDTDLVKDGAEAIRDLGNAIDTTVDGLPGAGLVHIKTETVTAGVTGVSVNDVFSADYKNYLVIANIVCSTGSSNSMRLRVAGADNTANSYTRQSINADSSTLNTSTFTSTAIDGFWIGNTTSGVLEAIFYNPFETAVTSFLNKTGTMGTSLKVQNGVHNVASSFTGFTLNAASGTITSGTIRVYGLKD